MIQLDILDPADPSTPLATLDEAYARTWAEEIYDFGGRGGFTIPHDSPVVQADRTILNRTRIVRVRRGSDLLFAWEINGRNRTRGDTWDPVVVQGEAVRGLLRYGLVEGEHGIGNAVPSDDRVWNFASLSYDTSTAPWGEPVSLGQQQNPTPLLPRLVGQPDGWQDPRAEWLWTEAPTVLGSGRVEHPPGVAYFRRRLAAPPTGLFRMTVAGTNRWECWLDGVMLGTGGGFRDVATFDIRLYGRPTVWGLKVEKDDHPWWEWDPGAIIGYIARLDDEEATEVIYRTYTDAVYDGPATPAPDPWEALGYPTSVPGFTGLEILAELYEAARSRGVFTGWSRDFTGTTASDGAAVTDRIEFVAQIGADNVLTVAQRLQEAADIDIDVTPGLTFRAWENRGVDRGLTPDPGVSTVTFPLDDLADVSTQDGGEDRFNAALVRSADRWFREPRPGPSSGRREEFLSLGLAPSADGAQVYAGKIVVEFDGDRPTLSFTVPTSFAPGEHGLGDVVAAPRLPFVGGDWDIAADWIVGDVRILSIAYAVADEDGEPVSRTYEVMPV